MEYYPIFSPTSFYPLQITFLRFSRKAAHGSARETILIFSKKFLSIGADSSSEEVATKIACMVPRETYRFTSKPFDMYARRRPLVSELFTGVSKIGTRRVRVIRLALPRETPRENRDQPAAKDSLRLQQHRRYSAATFPPTCRCTLYPTSRRTPSPVSDPR